MGQGQNKLCENASQSSFASVSWSFGSIYQRRAPKSDNLVLVTALQMLFGGALLAVEAAVFGDWRALDVHAITAASLGGFAWLVVFGSLFAMLALSYMPKH